MISLEFLLTSLIVVLIPGTGVLFTVSTGLTQGRTAAVYAAVGCTLGILPHLAAAVFGLTAVIHAGALAFDLLRYAGAAYLLYLAVATWRDRAALTVANGAPRLDPWGLVVKAFLLNILNPKLTMFFLAFLPPFIDPRAAQPLRDMLILSAVFMAMTFVVFVGYGALAHVFRVAVIGSARVQDWLRRGTAAAFAALGIELAWSSR